MKISAIDSKGLAEYLHHNLLMYGLYVEHEELVLIADMIIDYLSMVAKETDRLH